MLTSGNDLLLAMVITPAFGALLTYLFGRSAPRRFGQLGAAVAGLGFVGALFVVADSWRGGAVAAALGGVEFSVDRVAAMLLLLVFGVSAIVQAFGIRYLAGDPRAAWFVGGAGLLTAASAGLSTATTLVTLAACWTLAGVALCLLLGTYWHLPAARDGVRRTATAFLVGDLALWAGVIVATATWGRIDLRADGQVGGAVVPALGVLVVIAALSRSAQIPFHRWLPATLAAPTPVSALLHAGVVNAGGILLIRLAPVAADDLARALTVGAGAATMAYGAAVMLVKPDVKGALAHSTAAQMGFMILTCGLGLWGAALIHLFAHGFYKATLFLSSGSAIAARRRHEALPPVPQPTGTQNLLNAVAAGGLPAAALGAALTVLPLGPGDHAGEHALLIFAWVTGAALTLGWLRRHPGPGGVLRVAAVLVPAAMAYLAIITAAGSFLAPALPPPALSVAWVWGVTAMAAVALGALALVRRTSVAERLQRVLYAGALSAGHIPTRSSSPVQPTGARS